MNRIDKRKFNALYGELLRANPDALPDRPLVEATPTEVPTRRSLGHRTLERNARIEAGWKSGKSLGELSEEFGVTYQRIHQILKERGVDMAGASNRGHQKRRQLRLDGISTWSGDAADLYRSGHTLKQIVSIMDKSPGAVRDALTLEKVDTRVAWDYERRQYSNDDIARMLREAAEWSGSPETLSINTWEKYRAHMRKKVPTHIMIWQRFGSWGAAAKFAGLQNPGRRKAIPEAKLIEALRSVAEALGKSPTIEDYTTYRDENPHLGLPSVMTIASRSSWNSFKKKANLATY